MPIREVIARPVWCLLAKCVLAIGAPGSLHAEPTSCEPIGRTHDDPSYRSWARVATVTRAGRYCLTEDLKSKSIFDFASGGYATSKSPMWEVEAGPVQIDLQRHELSSNQPVAVISIGASDVSVANGEIRAGAVSAIRLQGNQLISLRSDYAVFGIAGDLLDRSYTREVGPITGSGRTSIPHGGLRLDHMQIDAGSSTRTRFGAVAVGGQRSGNSVTSSRITVRNGHAGIYLFGAGQRIENNTIVLNCPDATPSAAPIKLHAADNSIIRNNTIVVDCWSDKPQAAISLIDSRNVVIENNRIIGVKQLYKVWDERPEQRSSVIERGNTFPTLWDRLLER